MGIVSSREPVYEQRSGKRSDPVDEIPGSVWLTVMADCYMNYADLAANKQEGVDYRIYVTKRRSPVAIVAPHGGGIEPHTSRIAAAIAGDRYSLYCFEGIKCSQNNVLHITSSNLDEPQCLDLVEAADIVVTVHGLSDLQEFAQLGGRANAASNSIYERLNNASIDARIVTFGLYAGTDPNNICNRGRTGEGVQVEISRGPRNSLSGPEQRRQFLNFVGAVQDGIEGALGQTPT